MKRCNQRGSRLPCEWAGKQGVGELPDCLSYRRRLKKANVLTGLNGIGPGLYVSL